jgi:hypothetical protein
MKRRTKEAIITVGILLFWLAFALITTRCNDFDKPIDVGASPCPQTTALEDAGRSQ